MKCNKPYPFKCHHSLEVTKGAQSKSVVNAFIGPVIKEFNRNVDERSLALEGGWKICPFHIYKNVLQLSSHFC